MNQYGTYYNYENMGLNEFNPYTIIKEDLHNYNNLLEGIVPTIIEKGSMKEREQQIINVLPLHVGGQPEYPEGVDSYGNFSLL